MAPTTLDPYATLGVPAGAPPDDVARAHRRLAKQFHPDLNPGSEAAERMRRINEAWRILSSPARRRHYDAAWTVAGARGHRYGTQTQAAPWPQDPSGPQATASWTTWPEGQRASTPRTRRPTRPEPIEPSFGDRPMVVAAVWVLLVLIYFVGSWLGSIAP